MNAPNFKPNTSQKIVKMYAWIATEPDGGEGVVAIRLPDGMWMPLVGADRERIDSLRKQAVGIMRDTNMPIALKEFSTCTVLEELTP